MPVRTPTLPLAGTTVVLTRPDAAAMRRRARALGADALALPAIALHPRRDAATADRLRADAFDDWIFSSPAAVRFAFALAPGLRPTPRVHALGSGTRRALARHGVVDVAIPLEGSDSEGLLALPGLADVRGRRIALVGAPGGRGLITATLRERGAEVVAIHVYERRAPRWTRRHFDALAAARGPLYTLLSSGEALGHLVGGLPATALERLRRGTLVASSARLAALAHEAGFGDVRVARSAAPADLLDAVVEAARARPAGPAFR